LLDKFPSYSFVPGFYPHPKNNPNGHSYNEPKKNIQPINFENYKKHETYIYSLELFNRGYYWEAHEELEGIWNAINREGYIAEFLKALIKICASGVKVRQKQPYGVYEHSRMAKLIFQKIKSENNLEYMLGLNLDEIINNCDYIMKNYNNFKTNIELSVEKVFNFELRIK
jgi:predicted metal-dependent hydrolase